MKTHFLDKINTLIIQSRISPFYGGSRVLVPIEAVAIIGWWAYDLISAEAGDGEEWYEFGRETLVMTITQVLLDCSTMRMGRHSMYGTKPGLPIHDS